MNTFDVNHFKVENNKYLFETSLIFFESLEWYCSNMFSEVDKQEFIWSEIAVIDESVWDSEQQTKTSLNTCSFITSWEIHRTRLKCLNWRNWI